MEDEPDPMAGERGDPRWPPAIVAGLAIALLATAAALVLEAADGLIGRTVGVLLIVVASVGALLGVLVLVRDLIVRPWWRAELSKAQGLALVDSLPPGTIMERLLLRLYGDDVANDYIVRGVLGGVGESIETGQLSISSSTSVHYKLSSQAPGSYELISTVDFTFDNAVLDPTLVLFVTSDPRLTDDLVAACEVPLFDWIFIPDTELFLNDENVTVDVGVRYRDAAGREWTTDVSRQQPVWVDQSRWPDYLGFFRRPIGSLPLRKVSDYISTLRIFEIDLARLALPAHPMDLVTGLTLRSSTVQPDEGTCYWRAPFPCLLDDLSFDADELTDDEGTDRLQFLFMPFLPSAGDAPRDVWVSAADLKSLPIRSWAVPGHGVQLVWRRAEPQDGEGRP